MDNGYKIDYKFEYLEDGVLFWVLNWELGLFGGILFNLPLNGEDENDDVCIYREGLAGMASLAEYDGASIFFPDKMLNHYL